MSRKRNYAQILLRADTNPEISNADVQKKFCVDADEACLVKDFMARGKAFAWFKDLGDRADLKLVEVTGYDHDSLCTISFSEDDSSKRKEYLVSMARLYMIRSTDKTHLCTDEWLFQKFPK